MHFQIKAEVIKICEILDVKITSNEKHRESLKQLIQQINWRHKLNGYRFLFCECIHRHISQQKEIIIKSGQWTRNLLTYDPTIWLMVASQTTASVVHLHYLNNHINYCIISSSLSVPAKKTMHRNTGWLSIPGKHKNGCENGLVVGDAYVLNV